MVRLWAREVIKKLGEVDEVRRDRRRERLKDREDED
jgi:hypothetical protein